MSTTNNLIKTTTLMLIAMMAAITLMVSPVFAQDEALDATTEEVQTTEEEQNEETGEVYSFTAQPGDSYTEIARKTVQIYGIETETNMSVEQIVYVETNLTKAAGSPELNLGQQVTISKSLVKEWVDSAQNLSEAEQSLWTKYSDVVDFNTDSVGESRE